jgi:glucuronate isomerase
MNKMSFINDNFLLSNSYAELLYYDYAKDLPIIDYHNHLSPKLIAENYMFSSITELWLNGDHYKWRAMRTLGIDENFITGNASDLEKFVMWAKTVPYTIRNPLFHWTHLELKRYFDIDELLNESNAASVFNSINKKLSHTDYSCQNLLNRVNVEVVCTTEDPIDNLEFHSKLINSDCNFVVSTSFRPDKSILIESDNYLDYISSLESVVGFEINSYALLCDALKLRIEYFNSKGCRISDHGLNYIRFSSFTEKQIEQIFSKKRNGHQLTEDEISSFQCALLLFLAEQYHEFGWVQQFHLGALRNNNSRMFQKLGADTGWDSIGDFPQATNLALFLNALDTKNKLSKTILYNLNPSDNEVIATMIGNFNDGSIKGKIQFGSGWWFLDQKEGMTKQINALSNMGLISCFVGMLTDSRSFLSFPRHEYFRRILCNIIGEEIANGELPNDLPWIGKIVKDICYFNASNYFNFNK